MSWLYDDLNAAKYLKWDYGSINHFNDYLGRNKPSHNHQRALCPAWRKWPISHIRNSNNFFWESSTGGHQEKAEQGMKLKNYKRWNGLRWTRNSLHFCLSTSFLSPAQITGTGVRWQFWELSGSVQTHHLQQQQFISPAGRCFFQQDAAFP